MVRNDVVSMLVGAGVGYIAGTQTRAAATPSSYPSVYYDAITEYYRSTIDQKITQWTPPVYNPMTFTGLLWTLQSYAAPYYNSVDDELFLNMLLELGVDNVYMAIIPNIYDAHKSRYDTTIASIKANNKELLISYVIAGFEDGNPTYPTPPTIDEYIAKEKTYINNYITNYNPAVIFIVDEIYTMNIRARANWTAIDWKRIIGEVSAYVKSISPNTKVGISFTQHDFDLYVYNQVKDLPSIDVIAFNLYGLKRILEESTDTLCPGDCIGGILKTERAKGKLTMVLETWLSYQDDYTFYYGPRIELDSKWLRFITYYCQKNGLATFMPFFSCKYINEWAINDADQLKSDMVTLKRSQLFTDFKNLILEVKG